MGGRTRINHSFSAPKHGMPPQVDGAAPGACADVPAEHELQRNSRAASGYHGVIITANGKFQGRVNIGNGVYRYCEVADTPQQAAARRALLLSVLVSTASTSPSRACSAEKVRRCLRPCVCPTLTMMHDPVLHRYDCKEAQHNYSITSSPTSVLQLPDYGQPSSESLLTVIATPLRPGEARAGMAVAFAPLRSAMMP